MAVVYFMLWLTWRLQAFFLRTNPASNKPFYPRKRNTEPGRIDSKAEPAPQPDEKDMQPAIFRRRKKPQWVIDEVIYLKAVHLHQGCRKIAQTFSRHAFIPGVSAYRPSLDITGCTNIKRT